MAKDIVHHFLNRGYQGKAMVVSIDKLTTLRMYEKVRAEWEAEKARVMKALDGMAGGYPDFAMLHARLVNLQESDMAVVVSPGQNEISEMKEKGFDILPHRERMVREDLEFRLVFVCAMWLPGRLKPALHALSGQADARQHADANHRPRQPGVWREGERPDRGLRECVLGAGKGIGDLRLRARCR